MEPLQSIEFDRLSALPIPPAEYQLYKFYLDQKSAFWLESEFASELEKDKIQWRDLDVNIKTTVQRTVTGFNLADGATNKVIGEALKPKITSMTYKILMNFTLMMEDIHNISYSNLSDIYILEGQNKNDVFDAYEKLPIIKKRIDWLLNSVGLSMKHLEYADLINLDESTKQKMIKIMESSTEKNEGMLLALNTKPVSLAKILLVNAFNEGIGFTTSFGVVFWLKSIGILPGLVKANELINRDENSHKEVAMYIYKNRITNKLTEEEVHNIVKEGLVIEREYVHFLLPVNLPGLNATLMIQYLEYVANKFVVDLGYSPLYVKTSNPFSFINMQSSSCRSTDFFVEEVTEYNGGVDDTIEDMSMNLDSFC